MKKVNALLISIFVIFLLPLFALPMSATSVWAATYYVDAIDGNDDTGVPDNINRPYKSIAKISAIFQYRGVVAGDYIKFRKGTTPTDQMFRGVLKFWWQTGSAGLPITVTTYAVNAGDTYKPTINASTLITDHSMSGWTGPDGNGVYTYTPTVGVTSLYEGNWGVKWASSTTCSDGNYFYDAGPPKTLYYRPSSGSPADHLIDINGLNSLNYGAYWPSYITVEGLHFNRGGIGINAGSAPVSNWIIQDCEFKNSGVRAHNYALGNALTDVTIQNNLFEYCFGASLGFQNSAGSPGTYLRLNVLNNRILNNNTVYNGIAAGTEWTIGGEVSRGGNGGDNDCIAVRNINNSNFIGNEMTGYVTNNAAITYFVDRGQQMIYVSGAADDGSGLIRLTVNTTNGLVNGSFVNVWSVGGVPNANGFRWVVQDVDATHLTLTGSTWAGSYTSGGQALQDPTLNQTGNVFANNYIHDLKHTVVVPPTPSPQHCRGIRYGNGISPTNYEIKIYNNIFANNQGDRTFSVVSPQAASGSLIANNVIYNSPGVVIDSGENFIFKNNILSNITTTYWVYVNRTTNTFDNNCYYDVSSGSKFYYPYAAKTWAQWQALGNDANSVAANPMVTNQSGIFGVPLDFQLQSSSPCINAGKNVGLTSDFWGNPIPVSSSSVDIGVFQSSTETGPVTGTYSISPTSQSFPGAGGSGTINVTGTGVSPWTASSNVPWITITAPQSSIYGNGPASYNVLPNTTGTKKRNRQGTITLAGQQFSVSQKSR